MLAEQDPGRNNVCYILALMLERKRVLRPVESSDDDMLVYERAGTGKPSSCATRTSSIEQIPAIQQEVGELLMAG